jgi:hypothetical protein
LRTNNPIFAKMESAEKCLTPIILEDDAGIDEESEDATVENHVDIQYWFPNNGNPTCFNSVFHSQSTLLQTHVRETPLIPTVEPFFGFIDAYSGYHLPYLCQPSGPFIP